MKSALMAVAITALMGGLVVGPVTQQSAEAQVYSGLKTLSSTSGTPTSGTTHDRDDVILVGRGADAGDFKTPPLHQSGDVRVLGADEGQPEHPLQAVRRGVLGGNSSGLRLAVAIALYRLSRVKTARVLTKRPAVFVCLRL